MSLQGAVLKDGATYAPTGGTDMTFNPIAETVPNGVVLANTAQASYFLREKITASARLPVKQADGTFSLQKTSVRGYIPSTRADGSTAINWIRIETGVDPEAGAAMVTRLKSFGCGICSDSDFAGLFSSGDLR